MASHAKLKKKQKKIIVNELLNRLVDDGDDDDDTGDRPVVASKKKKKIETFEDSLDPDKSQLDSCLICCCGCCEGSKKLCWGCFKYSFKLIILVAIVCGLFGLYVAANMIVVHGPSATYWVSTTMDKVRGKGETQPPNEIPIRTVPPFHPIAGGNTQEGPKKMEM